MPFEQCSRPILDGLGIAQMRLGSAGAAAATMLQMR